MHMTGRQNYVSVANRQDYDQCTILGEDSIWNAWESGVVTG